MFLVHSRWNWNLEVLVLYERGKLDCPERILSEQGREPRTNSAHIQCLHLDSNLGHPCSYSFKRQGSLKRA